MDASVAWYTTVFGFAVIKDDFVPPLHSGNLIELIEVGT